MNELYEKLLERKKYFDNLDKYNRNAYTSGAEHELNKIIVYVQQQLLKTIK